MASSKKSNIQAAARRRILAIDFNDKAKLDTSRVKVKKRNDLERLLTQGMPMRPEFKPKVPVGLGRYTTGNRKWKFKENRDDYRTGRADQRRYTDS